MKTNLSLFKNIFSLFGVIVLLSSNMGMPKNVESASTLFAKRVQGQGLQLETPKEFSEQEYHKEIEVFYARFADFKIVVDLVDPNGIDPALLPADIALLVDRNTKVVAYKETIRPDAKLKSDCSSMNNSNQENSVLGIPCDTNDGTRDTTVSRTFGGVEQFSRVLALWYDEYTGCDRLCGGWEFEQQWANWTRTNSSWTVGTSSARMRTHSTAPEDFCTEGSVSLDYSSSWFTPTFYGNETSWFYISGFPNIAYVPFPTAVSETQGDIRQSGSLMYDDAITSQTFRNDG